MIHQRTLAQTITASGVGLHSGERVKLTLRPAPVDSGIVFCRTDLAQPVSLRAEPALVNDTRLSSTLVNADGVRVATVEHLMSALAGLGIDNIIVEMTGPETPIMDGSAAPFVYLLDSAGIVEQPALKRYIRILTPLEVVEGDKWVRLEPYDGFTVSLEIEFNHPVFRHTPQKLTINFAEHSYIDEVSRARTFGFMHEVEYMRMNGLGLGGNLDNAIVIDDDSVLNKDGLRFNNEFVRHKILDAIGDLYMIGHPLIAAFSGFKSGHAMNNKLLRTLQAQPDAWEYVTFRRPSDAPSSFHRLPETV